MHLQVKVLESFVLQTLCIFTGPRTLEEKYTTVCLYCGYPLPYRTRVVCKEKLNRLARDSLLW